MPKSFISEHTAEYTLVPKFADILLDTFSEVIPIFFWSTREGGSIARESLRGSEFLIVAMYARRPKVDVINQGYVDVKFNDTLFLRANHLQNNGIPVFAGVPIISNLRKFRLGLPCAWFKLNSSGNECTLRLPQENEMCNENNSVKQVNPKEIINIILSEAQYMGWDRVTQIIKSNRSPQLPDRYLYGIWGQLYKPVYFMIPRINDNV